VVARLHGRRERLLVAPEAVHEHGVRPTCALNAESLADGRGFPDDAVDQLGGLRRPAADPRQRKGRIRGDAGPGRLLYGIGLRYQ
jgi:hypothetical protein